MTSAFPEGVKVAEIRASCKDEAWTEGSFLVLADLSPETANRLSSEGLTFLAPQTVGRNGHHLSAWSATPIVRERPNGVEVTDRCNSMSAPTIDEETFQQLVGAIDQGEAYYSTFNDGEGLLVVPRLQLAAFYYYG